MKAMVEGVAAASGLEAEFKYGTVTEVVFNDPQATAWCHSAAAAIVGENNIRNFEPMMGAEDFGGFLQARRGAFIAIGQGEPDSTSPCNFGLHNPKYDFNDAIIPLAASYFAELVERRLPLD
jgi:hippurate hydrolase